MDLSMKRRQREFSEAEESAVAVPDIRLREKPEDPTKP
jgi:hypothetical protein